MFDFAWSELALIGIVGLIFIGPKDMPTAVRAITDLLKKGRKLAGEFQTHVDEMVRDADLGEARDSFRQLRSLNIRGQVMKALDGDGSLRRTLTDNPLSPPIPAAASSAIPGADPESFAMEGPAVSGEELLRRRNAPQFVPGASGSDANISRLMPSLLPDEEVVPDSGDPAPEILPPATARRLQRLRAAAAPPVFVPPGAMRPYSDPY